MFHEWLTRTDLLAERSGFLTYIFCRPNSCCVSRKTR